MRSVVSGQWGCSQRWRRRGAGDGWRGVAARRGGGPAGQRQVGDRPAGRQSRRAAISKRAPWLWTYAGRGWRAVASRRMRGRHAACVQVGRTPHATNITTIVHLNLQHQRNTGHSQLSQGGGRGARHCPNYRAHRKVEPQVLTLSQVGGGSSNARRGQRCTIQPSRAGRGRDGCCHSTRDG